MERSRQTKVVEARKLVDAANKQRLDDPLAMLPNEMTQFHNNGLRLSIECKRGTHLPADTLRWAFHLTKSNMQCLYDTSEWRWKDREKAAELNDPSAWYLLGRRLSDEGVHGEAGVGNLLAFVHFRYDMDDKVPVLYCYEIQLTEVVRRMGLGEKFFRILEMLALQWRMKKVMLTVFNANLGAKKFFVERMNYAIDETSPSMFVKAGSCTYEILSKRVHVC